jgi:hypothetical protein
MGHIGEMVIRIDLKHRVERIWYGTMDLLHRAPERVWQHFWGEKRVKDSDVCVCCIDSGRMCGNTMSIWDGISCPHFSASFFYDVSEKLASAAFDLT